MTWKERPEIIVPVSFDNAVSRDVVDRDTATAIDFLKRFTQGKCVILTLVPHDGTKVGDANAIAAALGMKLVTPDVPEGAADDGRLPPRWSERGAVVASVFRGGGAGNSAPASRNTARRIREASHPFHRSTDPGRFRCNPLPREVR